MIQQELEGLNMNRISAPPCTLPLQHTGPSKGLGMPTLPEPTEPPPPPPIEPPTQALKSQQLPPPPPKSPPLPSADSSPTLPLSKKGSNEPIYESVLPRDDIIENGPCASPPPLPAPPMKFRNKSPIIERVQRNGPTEVQRPRSPNSPRPSRPSSRASSTGQTQQAWRLNGLPNPPAEFASDPEREQRRKFRVEKKLQEMEELQDKDHSTEEQYHDIVEFAQNYFNTHEKSPEGTIIATLTRKSRGKSLEVIPKYEMVTFYKGNTIPNSHIHMYDPDNVNVACNIFRVSQNLLIAHLNLCS